MEVTTITTGGENTLLAGVRSALNGADSALLCVAFEESGVFTLAKLLDVVATMNHDKGIALSRIEEQRRS